MTNRQAPATGVHNGASSLPRELTMKSTDELLARVPLFDQLSKKELREVANLATRLDLPAGRELTREGRRGHEFIIVLEGDVDVLIDGETVASPAAGQCYGEIALLSDRPRTATVVARTAVTVDVIGRSELAELMARQPAIETRLRAAMAEHLAADQRRTDSQAP
jgi:CRP-like cAMP-binding protein